MRKCGYFSLVMGLVFSWNAFAQQRPLRTDDAEILQTGRVLLGFGVEFLQEQKYSLSGLEGDLTRLGVTSIQVGVGDYAEFQMSGVIQDYLSVTDRSEAVSPPAFTGNSTNDFGNLVLATKLKLTQEGNIRPAMAFKFAVELPNASQENGLGTDETQFYASLLFKKHFGKAQILANLGLAILGSAVEAGKQTDPLTYGFGAVVPVHSRINLVAEINGRHGPERVGNDNQSRVRAGMQLRTGSLVWDIAGLWGLEEYDPKSGIIIGASYEFQAFNRNKDRVKIVK